MLKLGPGAARAGFLLQTVGETGSTNADLLAAAHEGLRGPVWRVADSQNSGKGRQARNWVSPEGNLYASLLLSEAAELNHIAELSFVLALALADAAVACGLPESAVRLKWPNDLMLAGKKAAGLLLEGGHADGDNFIVAGMGVNLISAPAETETLATSFAAQGVLVSREAFFAVLSDKIVARLAVWNRGKGFAPIRNEWLSVAHGLDGPLRVRTLKEEFSGQFRTIDAVGRLVVDTDSGQKLVSAGDVFVLEPTAKARK